MRIACVGAGPAALTFASLCASAGHEVHVFERRESTPQGFGVVLWSDHLDLLGELDRTLVSRLVAASQAWQGQTITVDGHRPVEVAGGGLGIARSALLEILGDRAAERGARVHHGTAVTSEWDRSDWDIVVAADGAGSTLRSSARPAYRTTAIEGTNRYAWFEIDGAGSSFEFPFARAKDEWTWAHVYPHRPGARTFLVEMTARAWESEGLGRLGERRTLDRLSEIFAPHLPASGLRPLAGADGRPRWRRFRTVTNRSWVHEHTVLMGDAAHTTHFSVGSGTRYAMEDAAALSTAIRDAPTASAALLHYERVRKREMTERHRNGLRSARFFEGIPRYIERPVPDFVRLLQKRRSVLVARMPVSAFILASRTADRVRGRSTSY